MRKYFNITLIYNNYFTIICVLSIGIFISIVLSSCSEDKEQVQTHKRKINDNSQGINVQPDMEIGNEPIEQAIDPGNISNFLPNSIPGFHKSPFKTGINNESNFKITVASCEFTLPKNGALRYSITDYGDKKNIPAFELKLFSSPPEESGQETRQVALKDGTGYIIWDKSRNEGSFYGMIINRYLLRIEAYMMPKSFTSLEDYIKYFRLKELVEFSKKHK